MEATLSTTALAALAALESPRALMMAAPRCCTEEMNSPLSHATSLMLSATGLPLFLAWVKSGYCVEEWLLQMAWLVTAVIATPAFLASWDLARFSSRRVMANQRSRAMSGALFMAMRQLVLHGLPTK